MFFQYLDKNHIHDNLGRSHYSGEFIHAVGMWDPVSVALWEELCNYLLASLDENKDTSDKIWPDGSSYENNFRPGTW